MAETTRKDYETNSPDVARREFERLENTVYETAQAVHELVPIVRQNAQTGKATSEVVNSLAVRVAAISEPKGIGTGTILGIVTALIGFGAFLLTLVIAIGTLAMAPMQSTDIRLERTTDNLQRNDREQIAADKEIVGLITALKEEVEENESEALRERKEDLQLLEAVWNAKQDHTRDLINHERELRDMQIWGVIQEQVTQVEHLKELISNNSDGNDALDALLQREMRLLDEVLQREMGLHVRRLEDLIGVNTTNIKSKPE